MAFELKPWNKGVSDEELLAELRRVALLLGKSHVTYEELRSHSRYSSRLFEVRFGSWNEALRQAGLDVIRRINIPEIEFYENMERVWRSLGRQPLIHDLKKPLSLISGSAYAKRFGGWRKALEAFVAFANDEMEMTPKTEDLTDSRPDPRAPNL